MQESAFATLIQLFSWGRVFESLLVIALVIGLLWLLQLASQRLSERLNRYRLQINRLYPVIRLTVWTLAIAYILLGVFKPPTNVILAVLASAGIALGLGAQDIIRNVFAGIVMVFNRPFHIGDMVNISGHYGEVIHIDLASTRLQTFDDNVISVPNAEVLKQAVVNSNAGQLTEMIVVSFDLPASVDVAGVKALLWEATASSPYTYLKKPISVVVSDRFERTFLTRFTIKVYVVDVRLERVLASDITERVKFALSERGLISEEWVLAVAGAGA